MAYPKCILEKCVIKPSTASISDDQGLTEFTLPGEGLQMVAACTKQCRLDHQLPYGRLAGAIWPLRSAAQPPPWTLLVDDDFNGIPWFGMLPNRNKRSSVEQGPWKAPHRTCPATIIHMKMSALRRAQIEFTGVQKLELPKSHQNSSNKYPLFIYIYIHILL